MGCRAAVGRPDVINEKKKAKEENLWEKGMRIKSPWYSGQLQE